MRALWKGNDPVSIRPTEFTYQSSGMDAVLFSHPEWEMMLCVFYVWAYLNCTDAEVQKLTVVSREMCIGLHSVQEAVLSSWQIWLELTDSSPY